MQILRRLQPFILLLALLFMGLLLRSQWASLRAYDWQLNPGWLLLACLLLLASWLMEVGIWRHLLGLVGGRLPYAPALRIWFLSAIMRYIPGNVWQPLSMTLLCLRWGVRPEATVTSVVLYQAVILLAAVPMTVLYMLLTGNLGFFSTLLQGATWWVLVLAMAPVVAFVLRPQWLMELINWALAKLNREVLPVALTSGRLLLLLLVAAVNWVLWGASFAALAFALGSYTAEAMAALAVPLILSYPIAYTIGFLSFFAPSGFGVREGAFVLLLAPLLDAGVVAVIALAMRLLGTVGELIMAGISLLWARAVHAPEAGAVEAPTQAPARPGDVSDVVTDAAYER